MKYSSDLGGKQFGIKRILGKPDAFPQGGYSANAWTPKNALDGKEVVIVGFEKPQTVKQVAVFENLNAGCVVKISVSTNGEKFETVWSRKPNYKTPRYKTTLSTDRSYYFGRKRRKIAEIPNVFNPGIEYALLENSASNIIAVKVEFNFALLPGQKQIDAIGISDNEAPIEAQINTNTVFEDLANATKLTLDSDSYSIACLSNEGQKLFVTKYDDKEYVCSFTKLNGIWTNKKIEPKLSEAPNYNYVETASSKFILKGGSQYDLNSNETGFELFEINNNDYNSVGIIKVAAFNNYNDFSDASITEDLKVLIMAIETDFTQGGTDLYFAFKKDDGSYGMLQNMGKIMNSAEDESSPQLLSDQKTILFSSNGFSSFGNHDIFVSYRLDDSWKNWSEPINLGSKINSNDYDGQPFYDEKNELLYFTSMVDGISQIKTVGLPKSVLTNLK